MSRLVQTMGCLLAACILAALLVGGCSKGRGEPDRLSKRAYIEHAGALQADAAKAFQTRGGRLPATRAQAQPRLAVLDELITGYEQLVPPRAWQDEHDEIVTALRDMRTSLDLVSKFSPRNRRAITRNVARYQDAQQRYDAAIRSINATR